MTNNDKYWRAALRQLDPVQQCIQLVDVSKSHVRSCVGTAETLNREINDQKKKINHIKLTLQTVILPITVSLSDDNGYIFEDVLDLYIF